MHKLGYQRPYKKKTQGVVGCIWSFHWFCRIFMHFYAFIVGTNSFGGLNLDTRPKQAYIGPKQAYVGFKYVHGGPKQADVQAMFGKQGQTDRSGVQNFLSVTTLAYYST